jgi:cbb3-type cytochrome oxidase cytochrome c subunit
MNYGPLIFLAAFFSIACSWFGFVAVPQFQMSSLQGTNALLSNVAYPVSRPGLAGQGLLVYNSYGCAECHSQQVRQTGTVCDVLLTELGTNKAAALNVLGKQPLPISESGLTRLPRRILIGGRREEGDLLMKALAPTGAKAELWVVPTGPDLARDWGKRGSVARDFLYDNPVLLGSLRVGPDLANVGLRLPSAEWHLAHLYSPRSVAPGSVMPPYPFLFEKRSTARGSSPDALHITGADAPAAGYEIIPRPQAIALVAYLQSLHADAPLYEAPFSVPQAPPAATNAPASGTNAPASGTNAPVSGTNAPSRATATNSSSTPPSGK